MMITCMYTANLTAFMTLDKMGVGLESAKDLLHQDRYVWGFVGDSFLEYLMRNNRDKLYTEIANGGIKLGSVPEGVSKVYEGKFVFIDETRAMEYNMNGACNIMRIGAEFHTFDYAFGLPKNSPFSNLINQQVVRLRELAFFEDLWDKWSTSGIDPAKQCPKNIGSNDSLGFQSVKGIFMILVIGLVFSVLAIIGEFINATTADTHENKDATFCMKLRRRLVLKYDDIKTEWFNFAPKKPKPLPVSGALPVRSCVSELREASADCKRHLGLLKKIAFLVIVILLICFLVVLMNQKIDL